MIIPTTKKEKMNFPEFKEYYLPERPPFDAYSKELPIQEALGSSRTKKIFEIDDLRSPNYVPGVSGWRLTKAGLEINSLTLGSGSVPLTAIQNITSDRILGRDTAGSGVTEQLTIGGGIEFTGSGGIQTSAFTGDVTKAAGGTAQTIANDAVTFAKMQNIGTKKLIGRLSASTGDPEEIDMDSGTYTPTLTNVANLDASTAYQCQYIRIGNTVTVSGRVDVDPTAGAASTQLGIALPVASNFGATEDCAGAAFASGIAGQGAAVLADTTNDRAQLQFVAGDTTNQAMYFTFTYQII